MTASESDLVLRRAAGSRKAVSRDETQAKLDVRSRAAMQIKPGDHYTLADRFEEKVASHGSHVFLVYGDQRLSYAEVDARANQVAHALHARGLRCGDVCALAMENRPEFFFYWFGLAKLGIVTAVINTQVSGRPLVHALETVEAKALIVGEECLANFALTEDRPARPIYVVADAEKPASAADREILTADITAEVGAAPRTTYPRTGRAGVRAEEDMLLIFTSGTTGLPKAARYSHMRWMSSGDVMEVTLQTGPDDVFYCCLPLYHGAAATSVTSTALKCGSSIVLRRKYSTREFWSDVRDNNITVVQYIGEICRYLLNAPAHEDDHKHSLRCMLGAGLTPESWTRWIERFGEVQIFEGWGLTEANTAVINIDNYPGSVGRIPYWEKSNLRLVRFDVETETHPRDENGRFILCQPGEVGEGIAFIVDHPDVGAGRFEGYTSREATEKKILRNVFNDGDAYWSSGDLLRYDDEGYLYFVDRIGDTFRWKSENVSTAEVADALSDFPGVELLNIYGVKVPQHEGRAGMAAVVMQPGYEFDPKLFYDITAERLPAYAAPVFVRVSGVADLTSTFKLRKVDLQRQGYDPKAFSDPLYVRDEEARTYQPYSEAVLSKARLLPFA